MANSSTSRSLRAVLALHLRALVLHTHGHELQHIIGLLASLGHPLLNAQPCEVVDGAARPLLHHVQRLAGLGLIAVVGREIEVLIQLHGQLSLAAHRLGLGQVEQGIEEVVDGGHVFVLQLVGGIQVVAREVLSREALVGGVLGLTCRVYAIYGLNQHHVLGLKIPQPVANLLRFPSKLAYP